MFKRNLIVFALLLLAGNCMAASADMDSPIDYDHDGKLDEGDLARATQNPIANMISLPFQNNTNFNFGPQNKTQNILNIQPIIPVSLGDDWNVITRTIIPVVSQPKTTPGTSRKNGIGDTTFTAWFSPNNDSSIIWGVGPAMLIPTASRNYLGQDKWAAGPSVIVLTMTGPWVAGGLMSQIWDFSGSGNQGVSLLTAQPFINYNLDDGLYLVTAPIITSDRKASSGDKWTVPLGGGIGKVFKIGKQAINAQSSAYYNVAAPDNGADWQLRLQLQFLFPK